MMVEIGTETKTLVDTQKKKEMTEKEKKMIKRAKKAINLFESGVVESAYEAALKEAEKITDKMAKKLRLSVIEDEQRKNIQKYQAAKNFLIAIEAIHQQEQN